jgi:AraC-like DNA-binding protein
MAPEDMKFSYMKANLHKLVDDYIQTLNADQGKFEVSIDEIRAYIEQTCLKYEFSIQNVAEYFHMSYSGFSHYFKRTTGVSCKKYVDEYRTEQAIERIMNSLDSLDTIAQDVGFANASSFIRSFKKITGRTPGSYRNL